MVRNRAYVRMYRMHETDRLAEQVADVFLSQEPIKVFRHIRRFLPSSFIGDRFIHGCSDIVEHKRAFRQHMSSLLQGDVMPLAEHINTQRAGFAQGLHVDRCCTNRAILISNS